MFFVNFTARVSSLRALRLRVCLLVPYSHCRAVRHRGLRAAAFARVEGAEQKANGKWSCSSLFPGREFDDLDEFREAKKQRAARRAAYSDQIPKKCRVRPEVVEAPPQRADFELITV